MRIRKLVQTSDTLKVVFTCPVRPRADFAFASCEHLVGSAHSGAVNLV